MGIRSEQTAPLQIAQSAIDKFQETKGFDRVYVVFDRDDYLTYYNALAKAEATTKALKNDAGAKVPFTAIPSVPNFELWILLHFRDILAPIHRDHVYAELKEPAGYPAYAKNSKTGFHKPPRGLRNCGKASTRTMAAILTPMRIC